MTFRRPPQNTKRFLPPPSLFNIAPRRPVFPVSANPGHSSKDMLDIPLPNEEEYPAGSPEERGILRGLSSVATFVREHVHIEELILIGLILLILDEHIDDSLLLILLVYILIF